MKLVSVVIRTYNEQKYLDRLLTAIGEQKSDLYNIETVIVDSGSEDNTLNIAEKHKCRITHIKKADFTFGRSLNIGCDFANGDFLVFVSGHCIPTDKHWLENLVKPLEQNCSYTYGRQLGKDTTKFSERQLFDKYFPNISRVPQIGFFCNNANAAIRKDVWKEFQFNEKLTGCEDMFLAKKLVNENHNIGYVADSGVYHIHDETWEEVKIRYEREAIALQKIMPEIHVSILDTVKFIAVGIIKDSKAALKKKVFLKEFVSIVLFRWAQYVGAYHGNHIHRKLSQEMKNRYFYPRVSDMDIHHNVSKETGD